jgi:ATP-binding cassette, subfamily B, bacterial MsbA
MNKTEVKPQFYRRIIRFAKPYRWRIALSMVASMGIAATDGALAKLVQPFVDKLLIAGDQGMIQLVPLLVLGLAAGKGLSRYLQQYFIVTAGQLAIQDLRNETFSHLMSLSIRYHSKTPTGAIMSNVLNDIGVLQGFLSDILVTVLRESVTLVALVGIAFYTDWQMASIAFIVLPATAWPAAVIARRIKGYVRKSQGAIAVLTTALEQAFSGIKIIKSFNTENREVVAFKTKNLSFYNFMRKTIKYDALSAPVVELLTALGVAAVLWFGLNRVVRGEITQGELFSVVAAILLMYAPVKKLTRVNNAFQAAMGAAERVIETLELKPEIREAKHAISLERVRGEVAFREVTFSYDEGDHKPVVSDFSLEASPGEIIALVGPSGAGKTTVTGLLQRFYDPDAGEILLDGFNLKQLGMATLHQNVVLVDQEAFLFNDTILHNIAYGHREVSLERVRLAAQQAFAAEFIEQLPDGYETNIGDRGLRLSGGQRQRICIARAIYQDAPVLILDEATSALDTESESVVQRALTNLMAQRTTFVVAHRLSTIMHADKIVVMEDGRLVEQGKHSELLKTSGLYKRLYDMQFRDA